MLKDVRPALIAALAAARLSAKEKRAREAQGLLLSSPAAAVTPASWQRVFWSRVSLSPAVAAVQAIVRRQPDWAQNGEAHLSPELCRFFPRRSRSRSM
jgi:hypothetical protein